MMSFDEEEQFIEKREREIRRYHLLRAIGYLVFIVIVIVIIK